MKLFTIEDIRAIEEQTLRTESITTMTLVDRAASGIANEITSRWRPNKQTLIFAGPGNNGADALCTALKLAEAGFHPTVFLFNIGGNTLSKECRLCRDMIRANQGEITLHEVINSFSLPDIDSDVLIVDGLFGSGLNQPLVGGFKALAHYINESGAPVVSIDVPSGMFADWNGHLQQRDVVHATLTLAIQFPHIAFFFSDNARLIGQLKTIDIGLSHEAIEQRKTNFYLIEEAEVRGLLKPRQPWSDKTAYGNAMLVAGRYGMVGASVLAARAALRSGVGRVSVFGPQCAFPIVQTAVPDATFESDDNKLTISDVRLSPHYTAIGVGPGLGTADVTVDAVASLLRQTKTPLVIDADALNCIAARPELLDQIPMLSLMTPHAREFDRLFGENNSDENRLQKAVEVSRYYNQLILLKGHYTTLVRPDGKIYINSSGTAALATPGAGDVLTGVLTSLVAQGYKPEVSAIIGAFVHGYAARLAAQQHGIYGTTASDVAEYLGKAFANIMSTTRS